MRYREILEACWKGYHQVGMKDKGGRQVPNCVPVSEQGVEETTVTKTRLDPKCWTGKKIGNPKTKVKGGVRVNNCVPK